MGLDDVMVSDRFICVEELEVTLMCWLLRFTTDLRPLAADDREILAMLFSR